MDFEGVKAAISSGGYTLIDVRNPEEVQQYGKIPTGINIPRKLIQNFFKKSGRAALIFFRAGPDGAQVYQNPFTRSYSLHCLAHNSRIF